MLKSERQEMILEILQECKYITTQKLAEKTFSSYSSVRRDLEELEDAGLINRSYGKVELANRNSLLVSYPIRINKNSAQKNIIAKKAASLIKEGDTIFIDPSSSCSFFNSYSFIVTPFSDLQAFSDNQIYLSYKTRHVSQHHIRGLQVHYIY